MYRLLVVHWQISSVESMFEYYFVVTYADGNVVDIPAGKSAFLPAVSGPREEGETQGKKIEMHDERLVWDQRGVPECVSCFVPRGGRG